MTRRYRIAYLVTHPIQYQAPLLRLIAAQPDMDLTVFFQSDISLRTHQDEGFGRAIAWDIPLLDGYRYEFLPAVGRRDVLSAHRPFSYGFVRRLSRARFDVLWVHGYARGANWRAMLVARAAGLKIFVRDEANAYSAPRSPLRRKLKSIFFRILARYVDGFLAIGAANREYYLTNGVPADQIFHLPYTVDNDFFTTRAAMATTNREQLRAELGLEPDRPIILFASKFQARKRPQDLLRAYEQLIRSAPDGQAPYLLYVGDGELKAAVEAEATEKGLKGVRFLGFRNQTELPALFDLCDVFVLPSFNEPWGLVVNEVMNAGRAVIVTDQVGCARDLVKNDINGFIVPPGDVNALAGALRQVVSSPDRIRSMGMASREIIKSWGFKEDIDGLRAALHGTLNGD